MAKKEIKNGCHLYPMPVVIVGANKGGRANFMTAAFAGIVNLNPPKIALGLGKLHFTSAGIVENGVFSVNLPSTSMMEATDYCGLVSGHKVDKSGVFKVFYGILYFLGAICWYELLDPFSDIFCLFIYLSANNKELNVYFILRYV